MDLAFVHAVTLALSLVAPPAQDAGKVTPKTAHEAFQAEDWETAARHYGALVSGPSARPGFWYRLGLARHRLGKYEQAEEAYLEAAKAKPLAVLAHYDLACARALRKDLDGAFAALGSSLDGGFHDAPL
ncbi:MAG: tetratricopeptide repeat protein, partial [Planctomycetota bacterium]